MFIIRGTCPRVLKKYPCNNKNGGGSGKFLSVGKYAGRKKDLSLCICPQRDAQEGAGHQDKTDDRDFLFHYLEQKIWIISAADAKIIIAAQVIQICFIKRLSSQSRQICRTTEWQTSGLPGGLMAN